MLSPLSSTQRRLRAVATALCVLHFAWPVLAAAPAPDAREQYLKAHRQMDEEDWEGARRTLLEIWGRAPAYDIAGSLAQLEHQLGHRAAAARYAAYAVAHLPIHEKPDRLRAFIQGLKAVIGTVHVSVTGSPADVVVDGDKIGTAPLVIETFVEPGKHSIEASAGARVITKTFEVAEGAEATIELDVPPPEPTADATSGSAADATPPVRHEPRRKSLVPVYVGAGIFAVSTGLAVGFGVAARSAKTELDDSGLAWNGCTSDVGPACADAEATYDRQRRNAHIAQVSTGVAVVSGLATVAYWLFWPAPSSSTSSSGTRAVVRGDASFDGRSWTASVSGSF